MILEKVVSPGSVLGNQLSPPVLKRAKNRNHLIGLNETLHSLTHGLSCYYYYF